MYCNRCGAELTDEMSFCPKCGAPAQNRFTKELIDQAISGDQEAIATLYTSTYNPVYKSIRSVIKDEDAAMDILQDAYMYGFQKLDTLENPNRYLAWMKVIAVNRSKDYLKKKKPALFSELSDDDSNLVLDFKEDRLDVLPDQKLDRAETARLMNEILNTLSEDQRMAVGMYYYEEMSVGQIAEIMECSTGTVKSRLNYARKKIETKVLELEKQGVKLYGLSPIVFLRLLYRCWSIFMSDRNAKSVLEKLSRQVGSVQAPSGTPQKNASPHNPADYSRTMKTPKINRALDQQGHLSGQIKPAVPTASAAPSVSAGTGTTGAANMIGSVAGATGTAANVTAAKVGIGLLGRIVIGVVAAVVVIGGAVGVAHVIRDRNDTTDTPDTTLTEPNDNDDDIVLDAFSENDDVVVDVFSEDDAVPDRNSAADTPSQPSVSADDSDMPSETDAVSGTTSTIIPKEKWIKMLPKTVYTKRGSTYRDSMELSHEFSYDLDAKEIHASGIGLFNIPIIVDAEMDQIYDNYWLMAQADEFAVTFKTLDATQSDFDFHCSYEVDSDGRLASIIIETNGNAVDAESHKSYLYDYDDFGRVSSIDIDEQLYEGGERGVLKFTYDSEGKLVQESFDGIASDELTFYSYDSTGKVIQKNYSFTSDIYESSSSIYKYEYSEDGRQSLIHTTISNDGGVIDDITYEYDEEGRMIKANYNNGYTEYSYNPITTDESTGSADQPNTETTLQNTENINNYVTTAYEHTYSVTDSPTSVLVRIPQLTIDSPDAQSVNNEIMGAFSHYMDVDTQSADTLGTRGVDFEAWYVDEIVVIKMSNIPSYDDDNTKFSLYLVDAKTGIRLDTHAIMERYQVSDYDTRLSASVEKQFKTLYPEEEWRDMVGPEYYEETLQGSIAADNLEQFELFPDQNGDLFFCGRIFTFAGAGWKQVIGPFE